VLRFDRSPALYVYTAATIVLGLVVLAWATLVLPISTGIALGGESRPETTLLGLAFWIVVGLLGSVRVSRFSGHGVLTFHLPFVVAAMTLGGPVAAGWVALLATTELRELREVPWFGTLANHAGLAGSAVVGGLVIDIVRDRLVSVGAQGSQGGDLLAVLLGAVAFTTLSVGIAIGVVVLRDRLTVAEFFSVYDGAHRSTAPTETVLGWILALVFRSVGWWAPIVCALLVLLTWDAYGIRESARRDPLTGLFNRVGFHRPLDQAVRRARHRWEAGALVAIDLDGFKAINDTYGHAAGDAILEATGLRLMAATRLTDAAARLGGDEFAVLLLAVDDEAMAEMLARRLLARIREPIMFGGREISVGGSFGVAMLRRGDRSANADDLQRLADAAMYEAKRAGGGVHLHGPDCPGIVTREAGLASAAALATS
jgi:diguanylate cyclase (GGDEF)-like protein